MRPPFKVPTTMAKPGRNERCPCGSGKKYKQCCLPKDEAAERAVLAEAQVERDVHAAERLATTHPDLMREVKSAVAARLGVSEEDLARYDDLIASSNAAVDLTRAGKLDEAEAVARDLLVRFPDEHDGWERLGMVHEKRGEPRAAADCYRRMLDVIARRPDDYDAAMIADFTVLIAKLDPPASTAT
jgi:tetratricopeptide (TPR) repeat protein